MEAPTFISNYGAVLAKYGKWPSFHDAHVVDYTPPSESSIVRFTLQHCTMTDRVDAKGFYVLENHAQIAFRFDGVQDAELHSFSDGNILFGMEIDPLGVSPTLFRVTLDSVMDMSGSFCATAGEVEAVIPCNPDGKPMP